MAGSGSLPDHPNVDDWLSFEIDGNVTVKSGKVDIGQRISTAITLVAAEELDVDPNRIVVARRETGKVPNEGYTSGSRSMVDSAQAIRLAAATARHHMLALAARELNGAAESLQVTDGVIRVPGTDRTTTYAQLVGGKPLGITVDVDAAIKTPEAYTLFGRPFVSPGLAGLTTGATKYVHDIVLPGMLHARVIRPPHYNAKLKTLSDDIDDRLEGGKFIRDGSFLAVAHSDEWTALRLSGRVASAAAWTPERGLDDQNIFDLLESKPRTGFPVINGAPVNQPIPPLAAPPSEAASTIEVRFERAYQMHATIGPSAAAALLDGDNLTVWSYSQGIYPLRQSISEALGRDIKFIHLVHTPGAGCYGHNGADDAAFDAALVACALPGTPILMKWTREDEHAWEPYGSAMVVKARASLDNSGRIIDWCHENFSDSHGMRPRPGPDRIGPGRLIASRMREDFIPPPIPAPQMGKHAGIHRNQDPLYDFPVKRLVKNLVHGLPLRTSSLRGLAAIVNVLTIESMMDELAEAGGIDPVEFRLRHLSDTRGRTVLEAAAKLLPPGSPESGVGRGIGFARYKNAEAYAAIAIEVAVDDEAKVHLRRAVIAADAGEIVDRQGLISQFEGGFLQGCSLTLLEQVSYDAYGITSRDWDTYPILGFDNIPEIETVLIERPGEPFLGAGEATFGPAAGAIANAIYAATGLRPRRLPFTPDIIRAMAMA